MKVSIENVLIVAPGIWRFDMPPHQVRLFGTGAKSVGQNSILLLKAYQSDSAGRTLSFAFDDVVPLNVGTLSDTIALSAIVESSSKPTKRLSPELEDFPFGPGDREFIRLAQQSFPPEMAKVSERLLREVRQRSPGNLKRGLSRNFSETPDNFWYVIVQPQKKELSITVRGPVEHFKPIAKLAVKDDRGNTLFKVGAEKDIPAALDLIFHAKRKL